MLNIYVLYYMLYIVTMHVKSCTIFMLKVIVAILYENTNLCYNISSCYSMSIAIIAKLYYVL